MKTLSDFATPGYLIAGVCGMPEAAFVAGPKSARDRHALTWSVERNLLIQLATTVPVGPNDPTENHALSAHERST